MRISLIFEVIFLIFPFMVSFSSSFIPSLPPSPPPPPPPIPHSYSPPPPPPPPPPSSPHPYSPTPPPPPSSPRHSSPTPPPPHSPFSPPLSPHSPPSHPPSPSPPPPLHSPFSPPLYPHSPPPPPPPHSSPPHFSLPPSPPPPPSHPHSSPTPPPHPTPQPLDGKQQEEELGKFVGSVEEGTVTLTNFDDKLYSSFPFPNLPNPHTQSLVISNPQYIFPNLIKRDPNPIKSISSSPNHIPFLNYIPNPSYFIPNSPNPHTQSLVTSNPQYNLSNFIKRDPNPIKIVSSSPNHIPFLNYIPNSFHFIPNSPNPHTQSLVNSNSLYRLPNPIKRDPNPIKIVSRSTNRIPFPNHIPNPQYPTQHDPNPQYHSHNPTQNDPNPIKRDPNPSHHIPSFPNPQFQSQSHQNRHQSSNSTVEFRQIFTSVESFRQTNPSVKLYRKRRQSSNSTVKSSNSAVKFFRQTNPSVKLNRKSRQSSNIPVKSFRQISPVKLYRKRRQASKYTVKFFHQTNPSVKLHRNSRQSSNIPVKSFRQISPVKLYRKRRRASNFTVKPHQKHQKSSNIPVKSFRQISPVKTHRKRRHSKGVSNPPWPSHRAVKVPGDVTLGALMMVHERHSVKVCGPIMPQGGVQALEAMLYSLDHINSKRDFLPGVKLGAIIMDDCDTDTYGLEQAVEFIKGSMSNIEGGEYRCVDGSVPEVRQEVVAGVVGAASSVTSVQVANLLRLFKIPQVSYFSTSPELSNKVRFEYFSRTIPSDHYQARAMVEIIRRLGWSYISIVYEESNYGIKAYEELEGLLSAHHVCIAVKERLVKDSGVADEGAYDNIVHRLLTNPRARGVIVFGSDQEVAGVMRAVRRNNATGVFTWIGSDGWSARSLVSDGNEAEVAGTLSVQPQANPVEGFDSYFLNLTVENNQRNPWFVEYWEDHFGCRHPFGPATPYNQHHTQTCTNKLKLTKQNTQFEAQLQFVSDAVMAFAYALRDMHREVCDGEPGLCVAMTPVDGEQLLHYLRRVNFVGLSGDRFKFDSQGDGPARYSIIHFKRVDGFYKWIKVGQYVEGQLDLDISALQFHNGNSTPPPSVCSVPCSPGQARQYVEGESCCWHCYTCATYQVVSSLDPALCVSCPWGTLPNSNHTNCTPIPEVYIRPDSWWAIGAMIFSSLGVVLTALVVLVFLKHNSTPIVRASGRELSYVLLSGVLLCYAMTFVFVLKPSAFVCGVQRFGLGFCFAVVYSALLTKTNRISRIFNAGKRTAKTPSFISPRSQLCICGCILSIQVLITLMWCLVSPPRAIHHYILREDNFLVCEASINASYMIAFAYPIGLITTCTIYAILTRKIPEAFNESKHIGFTMYTTCIIWLAFVPIYFSTANNVELRITTTSVTISLSATVALVCLFTPKLYIILLHPERNVRQSMMPAQKLHIPTTVQTTGVCQRVDSGTQSEVIFPLDFQIHEKLRSRNIQAKVSSCTQTSHYHIPINSAVNGDSTTTHLRPFNGPLQDVLDVQL